MKKILLLILILNFSCTYIDQEKIDLEIHNMSKSIITEIQFRTTNDTLIVNKLEKDQKISKTLNFSINDEGKYSYWTVSFKKSNGKVEELWCGDILSERKKRILKLKVLDDDIGMEYNGECY